MPSFLLVSPSLSLRINDKEKLKMNLSVKSKYNVYIMFLKGLGSPNGFFSPVLYQKFKHNLQIYQLVFLLFEYLCAPNIQKN